MSRLRFFGSWRRALRLRASPGVAVQLFADLPELRLELGAELAGGLDGLISQVQGVCECRALNQHPDAYAFGNILLAKIVPLPAQVPLVPQGDQQIAGELFELLPLLGRSFVRS